MVSGIKKRKIAAIGNFFPSFLEFLFREFFKWKPYKSILLTLERATGLGRRSVQDS